MVKRIREKSIFLVHATPLEPEEWHYIFTYFEAKKNFRYLPDRFCFIGHSHVPVIIEEAPDGEIRSYRQKAEFHDEHRYIINVGSVGQPRDEDPDAAYAIFDEKGVEIIRVPYDVKRTQRKMLEAGLPDYLINRLSYGR
ncbi:MAG: hypothetical protein D6828_05695 [Nitrospirae bacterium]|nr:MAG: hypothetical protein D6828_05695 [Nitrospirota bacterium]